MTNTVILANGLFPTHPVPLSVLEHADTVVCCDGSANALCASGMTPSVVVGDMDSLAPDLRRTLGDRVVEDRDQETNDLTKAVKWCCQHNVERVTIVGATGGREDHTLGNLGLLVRYNRWLHAEMITDTGCFRVFRQSSHIETYPGQQLSVFSLTPGGKITSSGLKYPLKAHMLHEWWQGTLNEAIADGVSLTTTCGEWLVYTLHKGIQ